MKKSSKRIANSAFRPDGRFSRCRKGMTGQALVEYGLIGGFVALVSIAGTMALGNQLHLILSGLANSMKPPVAQTIATGPSSTPAPTSPGNAGSPVGQPPPASAPASGVQLPSGTVITAPAASINIGNTVQTAGINGATNLLADSLATIAQQLQQDGKIDPVQANLLIELANKGHKMADVESVLEAAANQPNASVTYDGITYSDPHQLARTVGLNSTDANGNWVGGIYESDFAATLQQVQDSGMLQDPDVSALVSKLGGQIIKVGDSAENTSADVVLGLLAPSDLIQKAASVTTSLNSSTICVTGNGTDNSSHCY